MLHANAAVMLAAVATVGSAAATACIDTRSMSQAFTYLCTRKLCILNSVLLNAYQRRVHIRIVVAISAAGGSYVQQ
jgi:hypothetical protein